MLIKQAFESIDFGDGFDDIVTDIVVQSDGKFVIAGCFQKYRGATVNGICRLFPNGELDKRYNTGTGLNTLTSITKLTILPDDSVILVGGANYNGASKPHNIIKINYDGSINSSFSFVDNCDIPYGVPLIATSAIHFDNIYMSGSTYESGIAFILTDGTHSYVASRGYNGGTTLENGSYGGAIQIDFVDIFGVCCQEIGEYGGTQYGRILSMGTDRVYAHSLNAGSTATTGKYTTNNIINCCISDNGITNKYYIGGEFSTYNGTTVNGICRLKTKDVAPYGPVNYLDTSFNTGTSFNNSVYTLGLDSLNRVLVGGTFTKFNSQVANRICRLNTDGSLDTTFSSYLNDIPRKIIELDNKNIVVVGDFTKAGSGAIKQNGICVLNRHGELIS